MVFGAAGGIGRHCVEIALAKGHLVTAVLRTPSKLALTHPNLKLVKGDVTNPASFEDYLEGKDAVISTIGVNGGFGKDKPTILYSLGAQNILASMEHTGADRAFFISASALEVSPVVPFFVRLLIKYVVQKLLKHMYEDLRRMETIIKQSAINWTIMRPPQLTDQPLTENYRVAINEYLKNGMKISRADLAHFIITSIDEPATFKAIVETAY